MKKKLIAAACVVLLIVTALGGATLAYLQDEDGQKNTMTLGNVDIVQNEYEWNADKTALQAFTQDKLLMPYVGTVSWDAASKDYQDGAFRRFTMNNVLDKYITVTNTGNQPAYVRTIIAIDLGNLAQERFDQLIGLSNNAETGSEFKYPGTWVWEGGYANYMNINGQKYLVLVAVHQDPVAKDEETIPSLLQVYLNKTATNADVAALGGADKDVDILSLSQAVQSQGFADASAALNEAFGAVTSTNLANWFAAQLAEA